MVCRWGAGVKAVLYLEFLAALARILSGCCVCVAAYVPFVLMTADACPTASDSGHGLLPGQFGRADTLCLVSAANIADRDALRLWFCCLMCLFFALFTWWTSIRTIRRQTVSFAWCSARKKPSNPSSRGLPVEEMDVGPEHVPLCTCMLALPWPLFAPLSRTRCCCVNQTLDNICRAFCRYPYDSCQRLVR